MGVYERIGVRNVAVKLVDAITWIRNYGFRNGYKIHTSLSSSKNGYFQIKNSLFRNPVYLRDNYSDKAIFLQVFYEKQYLLEKMLLLQPRYIVDAGANIGLASLYFSHLFPGAQVIAVEPQAENYELLKKNTVSYSNIHSEHAAVWHREEKIDIVNPGSLAASFMVEAREDAPIEAVTIPALIARYRWTQIDILKMDIEGAEKEIFGNNVDWLRNVRLLIIELHDHYKKDCTKTFFKSIEHMEYEAMFHHENIFVFFERS